MWSDEDIVFLIQIVVKGVIAPLRRQRRYRKVAKDGKVELVQCDPCKPLMENDKW